MLVEVIFGAIGKSGLTYAQSKGIAWFKSREARREMADLAATAIEAGVAEAPSLAEDLRSDSFITCILVPVLEALAADPSKLPDPDLLSDQYIEMFVARFTKTDGVEETLQRMFFTNLLEIKIAFTVILKKLRSQFYQSKHWKDLSHLYVTEATFSNTNKIIEILNILDLSRKIDAIDLPRAKIDVITGSEELRGWPRSIYGRELARPELDRLKAHVLARESGSTLLIGEAGSGKSALLAKLTEELEQAGVTVFGIKADTLPASTMTFDDISRALGMTGSLQAELAALARQAPVVLIIDQLDAVSDVMDRTSQRMKVLLRLVRQTRDLSLPVHVVVSSRPFEAAHDARFQQLRAEEFKLALPPIDAAQAFLTELGIDWSGVSAQIWETLRRPFALKLFVDLVKRGVPPGSIRSSDLLDRWLSTADLGPDAQRQDVLQLMGCLAKDMLETETLWRPIESYEEARKGALARAEACGLIVRSNGKISFCHQSWLDDFQAKSFKTGKDLTEYTWKNQDSLFVRATVLRSLQRLRQIDIDAYHRAASTLLWNDKTRRHIKHLVVDIISSSDDPNAQEGAWIEALVRDDQILANRALWKVSERWADWRGMLRKCLSILMTNAEYHWRATQCLAAEAKCDPDHMVELIRAHWHEKDHDRLVFRVLEQASAVTPLTEELIAEILKRTAIDDYAVAGFVTTLRAKERYTEACRIVALWFDTQSIDGRHNPSLFEVGKLAKDAPREFVENLLPRFLKLAQKDVRQWSEGCKRYPKAGQLPWDWDYDRDQDTVLEAFREAMNALAATDPEFALALIPQLEKIEIDEVQDVLAQIIISGGALMARAGLNFLLGDERRFQIGDANVCLTPGLSGTVSGLTSQELVAAISLHLGENDIFVLRDRIENWSPYEPSFGKGDGPGTRLRRLRWSDEYRMELLERLPAQFLPARRRRQIKEWRAARRYPVPRRTQGLSMATFVGSPMSHQSMAKARDGDIFAMLDEIHDGAPERSRRRRIAMDGGVTELSRAFGAFAKENPERAFNLCREKFTFDRHEHAAASLVDELSKLEEFSAERLLSLIHELTRRGFSSRSWKTSASRGLARLAHKLSGLPDDTIAMLESWLENEPGEIAAIVERRLALEAENERRNVRDKKVANALIFGSHGFHGMRVVPQHNYSILDAMYYGLMARSDPAVDQWLSVLERHALRPEDPHVWSFLLLSKGRGLYAADRKRVTDLMAHLWETDERIFLVIDLGGMLWSSRGMIPDELMITVIKAWFAYPEASWKQAAAELTEAYYLVEPTSAVSMDLAHFRLDESSPELVGRLFAAASAWRESDVNLRNAAHSVLMQFTKIADGDQAHAISTAVDRTDTLLPDEMTKELIIEISQNEQALSASLTSLFADGLQSLLLHPGFDEPVMQVTERISELLTTQKGGNGKGFMAKDFVQVSIALQRNDGPLRARAMDVYERLLDAGAFGAEEAARDVLGR
ncbi:ATP-binding protein [Telmatospirillum sp.]|uniref:ATP-binding protein n=1 Tax=Telmatospirillum sp. TaxID=2079197 RepID=UPI002850A184|nr:ATP-binding protein [Telmatospirillum sp.]MDR3437146.1 ATP-binding protein [Telmatospirillum sp.]